MCTSEHYHFSNKLQSQEELQEEKRGGGERVNFLSSYWIDGQTDRKLKDQSRDLNLDFFFRDF